MRRSSSHARTVLGLTLLAVIVGLLTGGCRTGVREDALLRMSAAEALTEGQRLMEEERYHRARPFLRHAFEVEPNSPAGREALLLLADSFALQGGAEQLIQAEARYRDFLNRFPMSDRADYAQFQIGHVLSKRIERPDRDQATTREAREAFEEVLRLFPTSLYADRAEERIVELDNHLAEHELTVGRFYLRFGLPRSAAQRFEHLLDTYPEYPRRDEALYYLGVAHRRLRQPEEAQAAFDRLRSEFPESSYVEQIPRRGG